MSRLGTVEGLNRKCALLLVAVCALCARTGFAVQVEFQLQGPNSLLADPFIKDLGVPMTSQDPEGASLTTTYSGTIIVDVDDVMNPTTITFISANAVAANSGSWLPQEGGGDGGDPNVAGDANPGTAMPANYGFLFDEPALFTTFYGAGRDTILSLDAAPRAVTGGQFDPLDIGVSIPQGWFDGNISSLFLPELEGGQREDLAGETSMNCRDDDGSSNGCSSMMGSYGVSGNTITLVVPLDFSIGGGAPVVQFTGAFTATASLVEELIGDYNEDGTVNAADYAVWRDNLGSTDTLPNDDIGGMIGSAHYDQWKAAFGNTSGSGAGAAVPEPGTFVLGGFAFVAAIACRMRRSGLRF